ncbi:hypothetical protein MKZ38_005534 [Zalerion maritima]|uniref:Tubulin-specific chaperone D C-terminal domain-containing protein n=1 Tax=Zalerion maritima TaxID=339359 RepID=A0AAD5WW59_9PEZI|nr:hypothetical protein MKZ38_005534 [Zalerion maritima]
MDATDEEQDIQLQKISADLIVDFDRSLTPFLRKQDGSGGTRLRSRVRAREANRLVNSLLEPFQELPQLLDPHLAKFVPVLSDAYLEHLQLRRGRRARTLAMRDDLLMPLPAAICRLIYTFCKIRGEKVILRFLNVETKYLELVLSAIQDAEKYQPLPEDGTVESSAIKDSGVVPWTWQERYVSLLWLSHLLLAPFDLSTISSVDVEDVEVPNIEGLEWPSNLPGLVYQVVPLAIKYLSSPGKERDGAKALLIRIAMRKDMQEFGMLKALIRWALTSLRPRKDARVEIPYHYIGVLSFLAGVLRSSIDTSDMDAHLDSIFYTVHVISPDSEDAVHKIISSSALARKAIIKVIRSVAALILRHRQDDSGTEIIEYTISYLLESLADNDTPVRLAASKALSIIALKLDPQMASEVIQAVLESLVKNVLYKASAIHPSGPPTRDMTNVDPLEWHGLMLTLSHLLYRRSPPAENLAEIVSALLTGLAFERRGMGGGSIGTNVRDASCFGMWAMARRYTTAELLVVETPTFTYWPQDQDGSKCNDESHNATPSVLQVLASELTVAASLDSAGNIRRGASAALQELIGRHPDTVTQGIAVVQTVDYHTVALRSRAIKEVALHAAGLDSSYGEALLDGLLGWRGIGDLDAGARRVAGETFGMLTLKLVQMAPESEGLDRVTKSVDLILGRLATLQQRQVEERHGLVVCLTSVIDNLVPELWRRRGSGETRDFGLLMERLVAEIADTVEACRTTQFRRPELIAEAASRLIVSSLPVLQIALIIGNSQENATADSSENGMIPNPNSDNTTKALDLEDGATQLASSHAERFEKTLKFTDAIIQAQNQRWTSRRIYEISRQAVDEWLSRLEPEVVEQTSQAALVILAFSPLKERVSIIKSWADAIRYRPTSSRTGSGVGCFHALAEARRVFTTADTMEGGGKISDATLVRWHADKDIYTRVSVLKSLASSDVLAKEPLTFLDLLAEGLDDYTTTARGDIGSLVRLESLKAIKTLWRHIGSSTGKDGSVGGQPECLCEVVNRIYLRVLRLSAEKLDRVRVEAQRVLALSLRDKPREHYTRITFSSKVYFEFLLNLRWKEYLEPNIAEAAKTSTSSSMPASTSSNAADSAEGEWMCQLLSGFVTSADTGNEDLVMCSRAALVEFCDESAENLNRVATALVRNLRACTAAATPSVSATAKKANTATKHDRILIPTLEVIAFLLRIGMLGRSTEVDFRSLCTFTQKAAYKSGSIRKIEACVKVYGGVGALLHKNYGPSTSNSAAAAAFSLPKTLDDDDDDDDVRMWGTEEGRQENGEQEKEGDDKTRKPQAVVESKKRLGVLLFHPWPRVRSLVVDELWGVLGGGNNGDGDGAGDDSAASNKLLGTDWGRAGKEDVRAVVRELGLE